MASNINYRYQPLEAGDIRLLVLYPLTANPSRFDEIACDLFPIPLSQVHTRPYDALSYAWGTEDRDRRVRIKSQAGRVITVTPSLYAAIERLRLLDAQRLLWIDQLCIDQENVHEKEDQVGRMRDIYRQATRAVVWLGEHDDDTDVLEDMYQKLDISPPVQSVSNPAITMLNYELLRALVGLSPEGDNISSGPLDVLERFLNRAWFRRAWVYQEAVVASRVEMIWGHLSLPFEFIVNLIQTIYSITKGGRDGGWHKRLKSTAGFAPLRAIHHHRMELLQQNKKDFLTILWHARKHLLAKDERDYIYAFLGFHGPTMRRLHAGPTTSDRPIIADYKITVKETYKRLARVAIWNSRSLDILQYVVPTQTSETTVARLPTWVPNWAERRFTSGSPVLVPGVPHRFSACGDFPHDPDNSESSVLKIKGHVISAVQKVISHDFPHSYFGRILRDVVKLDELKSLLEAELLSTDKRAEERNEPRLDSRTILRTLLVAGAFSLDPRMPYSLDELLDAYNQDDGMPPTKDTRVYRAQLYLRQTLEVSSGKRVFLTSNAEIGLGYRTMKEGDLICIVHGSKMPCVLRRSSRVQGHFNFVGHCYLDGWMFGPSGNTNPRRHWAWWKSEPRCFRLI
ncbi:heterokaryon incompatibility protein-domain-containing protein [Apodospora peruviana]|uniref:Heterokaryon incompatibility protein-domain-containing protein n=1 Tax=Apodospora peruviana TaxID=516989 RepID=A0AAE0HVB7_9PEZI|nr:heterokaryon incompatibility protein-domain-containing protein [Apodospora peruviana]